MVLRVLLRAHELTESGHLGRFAHPDDRLSATGRARAERARVPVESPAGRAGCRVLRAPEARSAESAELFGLVDPVVVDAFRDLDLGGWAGRDVASIPVAALAEWNSDPDSRTHGGETLTEFCARVGAALEAIDGDEAVEIVAHPGTLRGAVIHCLDAPPAAFFRVDAGPGHELALHRRGGRWTLRFDAPRR